MADQRVKVRCADCGGGYKNHALLVSRSLEWTSEDDRKGVQHFDIVQCDGCDSVRFRLRDVEFERDDIETESISVFPDGVGNEATERVVERAPRFHWFDEHIPDRVGQIYMETVIAFNHACNTLAAGGLRATVEAICIDRNVSGQNLQARIEQLVQGSLLARPQADALHEERFLGNAALHEIETPTKADLEDGLQIVESLIHTLYVLPHHAERLKKGRAEREAKKRASKVLVKPSS